LHVTKASHTSGGVPTGLIIGIIVAFCVAVLLAAAAAVVLMLMRRQRLARSEAEARPFCISVQVDSTIMGNR